MRPGFLPELVNDPFGDPALYVDLMFEGRALLFDLGDLRALAPRKILRVSDIFVSHCHMDHFMGFDWFLRICLGRDRGVRLYGPPGFLDQVAAKLSAYTWNLVHRYENDFALTVMEVHPDGSVRQASFRVQTGFRREAEAKRRIEEGVVLEEPGFRVRAAFLDHGTPCLGYALEEERHVNIWKNRLATMGLPVGPWLKDLKAAVLARATADTPIATPAGARPLGALMDCLHITPGVKIAYVTDVVYHARNAARIVELARDADWLFIECVFLDELARRAADKKHLTAAQAGRLARAAGARHVVPFHFSPIYREREAELRAELERAFQEAGAVSPGDAATPRCYQGSTRPS
jgi:ribonuclease Z